MKWTFWAAGILCIAALVSIPCGMWFLIGGPYTTAYGLLIFGADLLAASLITLLSGLQLCGATKETTCPVRD
jgi:hypothetical protein